MNEIGPVCCKIYKATALIFWVSIIVDMALVVCGFSVDFVVSYCLCCVGVLWIVVVSFWFSVCFLVVWLRCTK